MTSNHHTAWSALQVKRGHARSVARTRPSRVSRRVHPGLPKAARGAGSRALPDHAFSVS